MIEVTDLFHHGRSRRWELHPLRNLPVNLGTGRSHRHRVATRDLTSSLAGFKGFLTPDLKYMMESNHRLLPYNGKRFTTKLMCGL